MKRSRIFLGVTTACLAVVGVVSAKVAHFGNAHVGYYKVGSTVFTTITGCVKALNAPNVCTGSVKTFGKVIFTNIAATHPLTYTNPND